MRAAIPTIVLGLLLAGCLTGPSDGADDVSEPADVYGDIEALIGEPLSDSGWDPELPAQVNLDRLVTVTGTAGRQAQATEGYVETAVRGDYAYLCRTGPEQGLVIFDISDIEDPKQVGYINIDAGFEPDIEVSEDGNWAFWETQRFPTSAQTPDPTNPAGNVPHGIHIIDIHDKSKPVWAGFTPVTPDGPHSITYARIADKDIVFASTYAFAYAYGGVAVPDQQRLIVYELDTSLAVAQLNEIATYVDEDAGEPDPTQAQGGLFPHDVSVSVHPFTNQTLAYVAYWDLGVVMLDVSDPAHPVKLGAATDFGEAPTAEIHMARQSEAPIDGKVVVVAEPEIGGQETTGYMSMIDVSDPAAPVFISNWKIPGHASDGGGSRGPHYFDFRDGRVVMASYAAGFWVFDIHDHDNLLQPRTVAYSQTIQGGNGGVPVVPSLGGGSAFDAWWVDPTHVIGSETGAGLSVFRYDGPTPAIDEPVTAVA